MMLPRFENCIFSGAGSRSSKLPVGICIVIGRNAPPCALAVAPVAVAGRVRDHPLRTSSATGDRATAAGARGDAPVPLVVGGEAGTGLDGLGGGSELCTTIDGVGLRDADVPPAARPVALGGRAPVGVRGAAVVTAAASCWPGGVEGRGVSVCGAGGNGAEAEAASGVGIG
jgi:hypothetical protein